jgi:hypothetical protein
MAGNGDRRQRSTLARSWPTRDMSGLKSGQSFDGAAPPRTWPTHFGRMPRDELADPATDTAEEPAAVNVYQRVRCRPLYSKPVRHDLM